MSGELGSIEKLISDKKYSEILSWLGKNIHSKGQKLLCQRLDKRHHR